MNMQALMQQAKKIQGDLEKKTKEIELKEFTHEDNNICVIATGKNNIKRVTIKNEDIIQDREMLEDVIVVAINDVLNQVKSEKDEKLGKYTGGLGGLF